VAVALTRANIILATTGNKNLKKKVTINQISTWVQCRHGHSEEQGQQQGEEQGQQQE